MKVKTSITLSDDLVETIERVARAGESRSQTIERMIRDGLAVATRRAVDAHELGLINKHADQLNAEALDVLGYQADV